MRCALLLAASCLLIASSASAQVSATVHFQTRPGGEYGNRYLVSFPHARPIPDVANTDQLNPDKCDLGLDGPDGVINADDLICWTWGAGDNSARIGTFQISTWSQNACGPISRTATHVLGTVRFLGTPFPFDPTVGYRIDLAPAYDGTQQDFTKTFVDDCSPAFAPKTFSASGCRDYPGYYIRGYLWVPYDYEKHVTLGMLCATTTCDTPDCNLEGACTGGLYPAAGARRNTQLTTFRHAEGLPWSWEQSHCVFYFRERDMTAGFNMPIAPGDSFTLWGDPTGPMMTWDPQRVICKDGTQ